MEAKSSSIALEDNAARTLEVFRNEGCTPKKSVEQCGRCINKDQCKKGFCCPYLRLCVPDGATPCSGYAGCKPSCYDYMDQEKCTCTEAPDYPKGWAEPTCDDSESTEAPPATGTTENPEPTKPSKPTENPEPTDAPPATTSSPPAGSYLLEPETFVLWRKCPQYKKDCKLGDDYSACLAFGKELCNGIKTCIGFSINKNPNKKPNDIIYYTGMDTTCIEDNKELDTPLWDLYIRTGQECEDKKDWCKYITDSDCEASPHIAESCPAACNTCEPSERIVMTREGTDYCKEGTKYKKWRDAYTKFCKCKGINWYNLCMEKKYGRNFKQPFDKDCEEGSKAYFTSCYEHYCHDGELNYWDLALCKE